MVAKDVDAAEDMEEDTEEEVEADEEGEYNITPNPLQKHIYTSSQK